MTAPANPPAGVFDIVVYGAAPAGIATAVRAAMTLYAHLPGEAHAQERVTS